MQLFCPVAARGSTKCRTVEHVSASEVWMLCSRAGDVQEEEEDNDVEQEVHTSGKKVGTAHD